MNEQRISALIAISNGSQPATELAQRLCYAELIYKLEGAWCITGRGEMALWRHEHPRPAFGTRVVVSAEAHKTFLDQEGSTWERNELKTPIEGIYVGFRQVYEGHWSWSRGEEDPADEVEHFIRTKQHEVWLVAYHPQRDLMRVFADDLDAAFEDGDSDG